MIDAGPDCIIHFPPPLTDEQREQLRAIWTLGGRWLAKDESGYVWYHKEKPTKNNIDDYWESGEKTYQLPNDIEVNGLVSWSDPEPYDIGKALEVEG